MRLFPPSSTVCPSPFLAEHAFPSSRAQLDARYCAELSSIVCCLPCPVSRWIFSDGFDQILPVASYISILTFLGAAWLLITYAVLPKEKTHRSFLSIGLVFWILTLAFAFILPLGAQPKQCHDAITPNNMHTDILCGWTGGFLQVGAMGIIIWILLRAMWTVMCLVFNYQQNSATVLWSTIAVGSGVPVLLLSIAMPVTGVSYRLGSVCVPNNRHAFGTWFVWLLIFGMVGSVLQIWTIVFAFWKFALSKFARETNTTQERSRSTMGSDISVMAEPSVTGFAERSTWQRAKQMLLLEWRMILLSFLVVNTTIYLAIVFIQQSQALRQQNVPQQNNNAPLHQLWMSCLVHTNGDKNACLRLAPNMGLSENRILGTMILTALLALLIMSLMMRRSMFTAWYKLLHERSEYLVRSCNQRSAGRESFISAGTESMGDVARAL